jgi:hypothetical protein
MEKLYLLQGKLIYLKTNKMTTKVLIVISGGNINWVYSTREIEYMIIDHDNLEAGDKLYEEFVPQDDVMPERRLSKYIEDVKLQYQQSEEYEELE